MTFPAYRKTRNTLVEQRTLGSGKTRFFDGGVVLADGSWTPCTGGVEQVRTVKAALKFLNRMMVKVEGVPEGTLVRLAVLGTQTPWFDREVKSGEWVQFEHPNYGRARPGPGEDDTEGWRIMPFEQWCVDVEGPEGHEASVLLDGPIVGPRE